MVEEKKEREVEEREIEEKSNTSIVWQRGEREKRELKHVGPTLFPIFTHERRNGREMPLIIAFPILPSHSVIKDKKIGFASYTVGYVLLGYYFHFLFFLTYYFHC